MAIQFNDITEIGDVFEIQTNTPLIGIQSIGGYSDYVLGETVSRYFYREFRYSLNGITYSDWTELTNQNLINTFVGLRDIFDIQFRYTRSGTDATGFLTFISIELDGVIIEQSNPIIFTNLYFNKFFNYNDSSVLRWALNVLDKLYQRGIIANYMTRGGPGINDDDYIAFLGALTHFMAILVRYAREFRDFTLNDILLGEYLKQKGVFVNDGMDLTDLQDLLENVYVNFLERGTNEIAKKTGVGGRNFDGELLRLIRKSDTDEFIWGLIEPEKTIWNINNNSPLYKGTDQVVNLIKAYEFTQDIEDLTLYPLIEDSFVSVFTDSTKEVIRILNADSSSGTIISGIGGAESQDKLIVIDSRLSYEVTFQVKQAILGDYLSLKVNLYDKDEVLLTDAPLSAISGSQTNTAIDTEQLLQNDEFYFIRLILFNENISTSADYILDIGFGNHLIINNPLAKFMSIELGVEVTSGGGWDANNDLRIYDFKVRPLITNIPNSFVMVSNIISSFIDNNSEDTNRVVQSNIKRYLIPYNSILKNQFLDELFVPVGTPLTIQILFTNETILGAENGTITITAIGGKPPYQYSIDNGSNFQSTGIFTNLAPSTYNILVRDANSVDVTDTIIIGSGVNNLAFQIFITPSSRIDTLDGEVQVLASGGLPPYFYSINGSDYFSNNVFIGLGVGSYTMYVRDSTLFQVDGPFEMIAIRNRTISMNVVSEGSLAIDSANIAVISENYLTNGLGNAVIYLEDGNYDFVITKSGYRTTTFTNIVVSNSLSLQVVLQTYYQITFTIEDSSGVGITNAIIQTTLTPATQDPFVIDTPSGSGTVIKSNIIAGNYSFLITKQGYEPESANINLVANDSLTVVMSMPISTLTVHVNWTDYLEGSENLENVSVRVTHPIYGVQSGVTDSNGDSSFEVNVGTGYIIEVSKEGYSTETKTGIDIINDITEVFTVERLVILEARVVFVEGDPLGFDYTDVEVRITGDTNYNEMCDVNGLALFYLIKTGIYDMEAFHPIYGSVVPIYDYILDKDDIVYLLISGASVNL